MPFSLRRITLTGLLAFIASGAFLFPTTMHAAELDEGLGRPPAATVDSFIQFNHPQVPIPGLNPKFMIVAGKGESVNGCPETAICARTLTMYINAFYRYAAAAAISFAIVLIMIGGIQYTVGSAMGQIESGKKRMWNAVIGLVLVLSTTAILSFVNPDIVTLKPLALDVVKRVDYNISYRQAKGSAAAPVNVESGLDLRSITWCGKDDVTTDVCVSESGPDNVPVKDTFTSNLSGSNLVIEKAAVDALQQVLTAMYRFYGKAAVHVRQGYENPLTDAHTFFTTCVLSGECNTCDPFAAQPDLSPWQEEALPAIDATSAYTLKEAYQTIFDDNGGLKGGGAEALREEYKKIIPQMTKFACPVHSGKLVNLTCSDGKGGPEGLIITNGRCQTILEVLMKEKGFCRSYAEPWLFLFGSFGDQQCDWVPGRIFVNKNGDNVSDQTDCDALALGENSRALAHMGKFADSVAESCVFNYALTDFPVDVRQYAQSDSISTAPHSDGENAYLSTKGLLTL